MLFSYPIPICRGIATPETAVMGVKGSPGPRSAPFRHTISAGPTLFAAVSLGGRNGYAGTLQ